MPFFRTTRHLTAVIALLVASCTESAEPTAPLQSVPSTLSLTPSTLTLPSLGSTAQIAAVVGDQNGVVLAGHTITWESSEPAIVDVSDGFVTALAEGTASITAATGSLTASAAVTVDQVAFSLVVSPLDLTFSSLGDTLRLSAAVRDAGSSPIPGRSVSWESADPEVATVDSDGLVRAVAQGSATITASYGDFVSEAEVTVSQMASRLSVSSEVLALSYLGESAAVEATAWDAGGSQIPQPDLAWSSSDAGVASVSKGVVTAQSAGSTEVIVSAESVEAFVTVAVEQIPEGISVLPNAVTLSSPGETTSLEATVSDSGGSEIPGAGVEWASADERVVTVSPNGVVTGVSQGITRVVVTSGEATAEVEVQVEGGGTEPYVGKAYVSGLQSSVLDAGSNTRTSSLDVRSGSVAVSPDGTRAVLLGLNNVDMYVLDTEADTVFDATITGVTGFADLEFSAAGSELFVLARDTVAVVSVVQSLVTSRIGGVGDSQTALSMSPDGQRIYTVDHDIGVVVVDPVSQTVLDTIPLDGQGQDIAIGPGSDFGYVPDSRNDRLLIVDLADRSVASAVPLGENPRAVALSSDGRFAYVVCTGSDYVSVVDLNQGAVSDVIPVGLHPYGLAVTPDGRRLFVVNHHSEDVSVVDLSSNQVIATIPLATSPYSIAFSPN